ncbi:LysR family transcriptional regulator substrate-binding protein [Dysosmobacter sp.]|uniref:LysR family transcriptional regulator substrate-binding protein n=1 Tax=Dysosmobacter sp. TaxID=2591382 RepID=UPI002A8C2EED|nr:LysR family transcriptional regulator substrate-binding protein [Dysosmobacter sp.]MDY3282490.1 LysR family transcriptional regulator substrate-binding protein [Dysosmobacter sp.]
MLELTACGEQVLELAREICRLDSQVQQIASGFRGLTAGKVRIGAFSIPGTYWIPQMVKTFRQQHPNIEFEIYSEHCEILIDWLLAGRIDMSFTALPIPEKMDCIPLRDDPMVAILPRDHPLSGAECFPVERFGREEMILTYRGAAMSVFQAARVKPNIKYAIADANTAISMVENGLGISLLPQMVLAGHDLTGLCAKRLDKPCYRTFGIVLPDMERASPAAKEFIRHAQVWMRAHSGTVC